MKNSYNTIELKATGQYNEKGSKFLAFAYPVASKERIKSCLEELRATYHDARHHCYAYILGEKSEEIKTNDDGEPSHSAGDSIMRSIKSRNLTNVLVVVVRYFGGTKLGIRGLINAYGTAAEEALRNANQINVEVTEAVVIKFKYENTGAIMKLLDQLKVKIVEQEFVETCEIQGEVSIDDRETLVDKLKELEAQEILLSFDVSSKR